MKKLISARPLILGASLLVTLTIHAADNSAAATPLSASDLQFFENKIRPVLIDNCYKCHSVETPRPKARLVLDTRDGLLKGGVSGPAIVAGNPDESILIQAIRYTDADLRMPPEEHGGKLSDQQIADLTEWVRRGAPDPRVPAIAANKPTGDAAPAHSYGGDGRDHWSFQPVKNPAVPSVKDSGWGQSPIDNFVLAKLENQNLHPNAIADKRTLIRRATFDLTGLPPTEDDIQNFIADESPVAFAKVVDRLLASPHYGERWARYWLDVARYSDTKGDPARREDNRFPHAWTYRDYVIDAFNADKPYDQFITEQLTADRIVIEAERAAKKKKQEGPVDQSVLAAMGFLTLGNQFDGRRDDVIADRIDVTTKAFLGLTVACARCHDHKFDPIPTKDYYSLYGVFANTADAPRVTSQPMLLTKLPKTPELIEYLIKADAYKTEEEKVKAEFAELRRTRSLTPEIRREYQRKETQLQRSITDLETSHPGAPARANVVVDVPRSRDYAVLVRGEPQNKGDMVPRRFLEILSPDPKKRPTWNEGSGRIQLAKAITDPKNPLTARVMVNRIWQQHFGEGFVNTPDDLGTMSSAPVHPELLDWLATKFVSSGWSLKQLHRTIMLSSTYQQSGDANPTAIAADPDNKLLWRSNLRRLDFEEIYDAILAISGTLDFTVGGKSVPPSSEAFGQRRSLYTMMDRRNPPELFTQFDFPNPDMPSGKRYDTTVPQQALFLMNSPQVVETARKLTHRPEFTELKTDRERVSSLYLAIFQRPPSDQEVSLGVNYVRANPAGKALEIKESPAAKTAREKAREKRQAQLAAAKAGRYADQRPIGSNIDNQGPADAWTKLAHALFQTNEAVFVN
ncbi:DUF1553 domain-containing protein [Oleiharenicola lentus]|uniref:DUF1553 domain-containing protein n=1 Tax=Oleiharenicola lentus TaxID=2508720 RepID=UPI003F66588D